MTTLSNNWHTFSNKFRSKVQNWWNLFFRKKCLPKNCFSWTSRLLFWNPVEKFFLQLQFILSSSENTFSFDKKMVCLKTFLWAGRMRFWEPCWEIVINFPILQISENNLKTRNFVKEKNLFNLNVHLDTYKSVLTLFLKLFEKQKVPKKKCSKGFIVEKWWKMTVFHKKFTFLPEKFLWTPRIHFWKLFWTYFFQKKCLSAAKIGKIRSLKRTEKRKFFRENFFSGNRSPGHIEYTSNTPDDNISTDVTVSTPEPTIDKKSEIYKKNFLPKLFCRTVKGSFVLPADSFTTELRNFFPINSVNKD